MSDPTPVPEWTTPVPPRPLSFPERPKLSLFRMSRTDEQGHRQEYLSGVLSGVNPEADSELITSIKAGLVKLHEDPAPWLLVTDDALDVEWWV